MPSYHYLGNEDETIPEDVSELVIHPLVQEIPYAACEGYDRLISVNFNGFALQIIGHRAFFRCTALKEIEIPPSVTAIGGFTFSDCGSLTRVRFQEDGVLTTIGGHAFSFCNSLTDISIPSSVETIQSQAFCGCKCLARVSFQEGLKIIGCFGFQNCKKLEYVGIPGSLEVLEMHAFSGCKSLREVNIEEGHLRVIGSNTFYNCYRLLSIDIPSTVERIEQSTFKYCRSLEVLKLRNGLKFVGDLAFCQCESLQAVELPQSLETIGCSAFEECHQLVTVRWEHNDTALTIRNCTFWQCESLVNICLSSECEIVESSFFPGTRLGRNRWGKGFFDSFLGCTALRNHYGRSGIPTALMHRFDNFPIHKKCYQASVTTTDELAREIQSSMQSSSQTSSAERLVDPFGMTPFHVLLSGGSCRNDLLQVLLDAYPPAVLGWKDVNGKTAFEYLTQRKFLDEDSRTMLRMTLEGWLVGPILSWNALDVWKVEMTSRVDVIVAENAVVQRQALLEEATMILPRYERIEATTLLELSLWKIKLECTSSSSNDGVVGRAIVDSDDRGAHRIRSGASVVIPNVIAFFF